MTTARTKTSYLNWAEEVTDAPIIVVADFPGYGRWWLFSGKEEHPIANIPEKKAKRQLQESIRRIEQLKVNWDSYGSNPPSSTAIDAAKRLVRQLEKKDLIPDWADPTGDASIVMQCHDGDTVWKWEIDSDGDVGVMKKPAVGEAIFFDTTVSDIENFPYGK